METDESDILALDFLKDLIEGLISKYKEYKITSLQLSSISKALYITENFRKIDFDGSINIEAGTRYEGGGSNYFSPAIHSNEIIFSQHGSEYTEGVGSDSVSEDFFTIGQGDDCDDVLSELEKWKDGFFTFFPEDTITVEDEIETSKDKSV